MESENKTLSLRIQDATSETVFAYKGEAPALWVKALNRIIDADTSDWKHQTAFVETSYSGGQFHSGQVSKQTVRQLRQLLKSPCDAVTVERIIDNVLQGRWDEIDLDFGRGEFKKGVNRVWRLIKGLPEFALDAAVLEILLQTCGVSVEWLTLELWEQGQAVTFRRVRDALLRLEKLYLVEYHAGQYGCRGSLIYDEA